MTITANNISRKHIWIKAAVIGSLWASIEIILGSFFHNLRLPFAGTILAFFGNILIIAFHQKWDNKGIIIKAGIICALMRSLSITSVILGPMIGVLLEAFFIEYSVRFFGKNLFAYILGSVLGLLSAFFHKIISILIIYGFDIVSIIKNLYNYSLKQLNITSVNPIILILIIVSFYALLGIIAAILGFYIGKKSKKSKSIDIKINFDGANNLFAENKNYKYSVLNLFLVFSFIIIGLLILEVLKYYISIPIILAYSTFLLLKYKSSFKRLRKPIFWIQILIIIIFAALFYNGFSKNNLFNKLGFIVGIKMSLRAILIVISFSIISFELRNPLVKKILYKRGFSQLYMSLGLAFQALPSILRIFLKAKNILRSPVNQISEIISYSDSLYYLYLTQLKNTQKIIIISGERRKGKTTFLKNILSDFDANKITYSGIISEGIDDNDKRIGFNIIDLTTNKKSKLCSVNEDFGNKKIGKFYFDENIIESGNKIIQSSINNLIIIDEVGYLELEDLGWAPSINKLIEQKKDIILVVRKKLLEKVINKWNFNNAQIFDISEYSYSEVSNIIINN